MKTLYWSFLLMLLPSMAYTQNTEKENEFTMSMQIRPRAEYRNGALTPRDEGVAPTSFINNRARLSMDYKRSDLELKMSAQHVGVWGQDPQIEKNGRFMLNEAWAKLNFGEGFFAQLGRQSLIYDDERILGGLDWNVAGRYHDALKLGYANKNNEVHLILAFNQNNDNRTSGGTYYDSSTGQPYKNMQTVWYHYKADNVPFGASLLFMNLGLETGDKATDDSHTRYLQTMGTYLTYKNSNWNLDGAFYYQMGKNKAAEKVSALMGSIQAAYTFNQTWGAVASFDYLSGDKGNGGKYKAFDPLYGTHHKFYGAMDYFYASTFANGYAPGLMDARIGGRFRLSARYGTIRALGTLCGVLSVAVLAGGVVLFGNYQKMREMESVLVSVLPDGVRGTADGKEAVTVEQLRGSVTPLESGDVDADGTTAENGGQAHKWTLESAADGDTEGTAIAGRQNGQASGGQSEEDGKMAETKAPYILPEPEAQRDLPNPGGNSTAGQDYPVTNLKPGGTYTVGDGETLYGICFKLYGNIRHLDDILAVNHLTDENRIIAGQTLVLPDVSGE